MTWEYIAGFLDGDGWITISKDKNRSTKRYVVGFTQSARQEIFMLYLQSFLIENGIKAPMINRSVSNNIAENAEMLNIHVKEQKSVVTLLELINPHLFMKKELGEEALLYTKDRLEKRGYGLKNIKQKKKMYWKEEEDNQLKILQEEGFSNIVIANKLKRSVNSVGSRLSRLGIIRDKKFWRN